MQGQGQTPEGGPEVVEVGAVGKLVGQCVAQGIRVLRRLRREVDGGSEHPEQAGGGQARRRIDGDGGVNALQPLPPLSQPTIEAKVGDQHDRSRQSRPRQPQGKNDLFRGQDIAVPGNCLPISPQTAHCV